MKIRRISRNFDGTGVPGRKLGDLLPLILSEVSRRAGEGHREVFREWLFLMGEKMAPMTEPISFFDGVLTVKVKSATLYSLLCHHEKPRLLKQLQRKFPVRQLVLRAG